MKNQTRETSLLEKQKCELHYWILSAHTQTQLLSIRQQALPPNTHMVHPETVGNDQI